MRRAVILSPAQRFLAAALSDAQGRNRTHLPAFIPLSFVRTVAIPTELYNEPFAYVDTEERPEVTVERPSFLFKIEADRSCSIVIGTEVYTVGLRGSQTLRLPQKSSTNVSILNIYDTYGLEVAWSYTQHIYYHKYDAVNRRWLEFYLIANLLALGLPVADEFKRLEVNVLYLCSSIITELIHLDNKKLKLASELLPSSIELPPEVIALITGSQRLNSNIRRSVRTTKCTRMPTLTELTVANELSKLDKTRREGSTVSNRNWSLDVDHLFVLRPRQASMLDEIEGDVVQFSLYDYSRAFTMRYCNGANSTRDMLVDLQIQYEVVTVTNLNDVCAWIVQLSSDLGGESGQFDMQGLGTELQRLLSLALERSW